MLSDQAQFPIPSYLSKSLEIFVLLTSKIAQYREDLLVLELEIWV